MKNRIVILTAVVMMALFTSTPSNASWNPFTLFGLLESAPAPQQMPTPTPTPQAAPTPAPTPSPTDGRSWWDRMRGNLPAITVNPTDINFGDVTTGQQKQVSVEIKNTGDATLGVTNVRITGADAAEFSVSPTRFNVDEGAAHNVTVTFNPTSDGAKTATLFIDSTDPIASPTMLGVRGMGVEPGTGGGAQIAGAGSAGQVQGPRGHGSPLDTMQVHDMYLDHIPQVGGSRVDFLRLTDPKGRGVEFRGDWVNTAALVIDKGDWVAVYPDTVVVISRGPGHLPLQEPIFMNKIAGQENHHPGDLTGRGVIATIVGRYTKDVSFPAASREIRVQVFGIGNSDFKRFLENVQAAGVWISLEPVSTRRGWGPSDGHIAAAMKVWGSVNDFPREIKDSMGRKVYQTVWPNGISISPVSPYVLEGYPREPVAGKISPDGIVNNGDTAPFAQALRHRHQPVHSAIAISEREAKRQQQAAASASARRKAAAKAALQKAKSAVDSALAPTLEYADDPELRKLREAEKVLAPVDTASARRAGEAIQKRLETLKSQAQAEADAEQQKERKAAQQKERKAELQDAVSAFRALAGKKLGAHEAEQLRAAIATIENASHDEMISGWPSVRELREAEQKLKRVK